LSIELCIRTCAIIVCSAIQSIFCKVKKKKDKYHGVVFNWIIIRIFIGLEICKAGITILHIKSTEARERWLWEGFLAICTPKSTQRVQSLCVVQYKVQKAKTNTPVSCSTGSSSAFACAWKYAKLALLFYTLKARRQGKGGCGRGSWKYTHQNQLNVCSDCVRCPVSSVLQKSTKQKQIPWRRLSTPL